MPWKKGQSGNPNGTRGLERKNKYDIRRDKIAVIVEKIIDDPDTLTKLETMDPVKKLELLSRLLPFYVPRLEPETVSAETPVKTIDGILTKMKDSKVA